MKSSNVSSWRGISFTYAEVSPFLSVEQVAGSKRRNVLKPVAFAKKWKSFKLLKYSETEKESYSKKPVWCYLRTISGQKLQQLNFTKKQIDIWIVHHNVYFTL